MKHIKLFESWLVINENLDDSIIEIEKSIKRAKQHGKIPGGKLTVDGLVPIIYHEQINFYPGKKMTVAELLDANSIPEILDHFGIDGKEFLKAFTAYHEMHTK